MKSSVPSISFYKIMGAIHPHVEVKNGQIRIISIKKCGKNIFYTRTQTKVVEIMNFFEKLIFRGDTAP